MIFKPKHFTLNELVCSHVLNKWGEMAWQFPDERAMMTIDFLRAKLGVEIYVNNYDLTEDQRTNMGLKLFSQRGLRCIQCQLVQDAIKKSEVYCSAHIRGQAFDINAKGMSTASLRLWIVSNAALLPFPLRLEKVTNGWVHFDVCNSGKDKVELF